MPQKKLSTYQRLAAVGFLLLLFILHWLSWDAVHPSEVGFSAAIAFQRCIGLDRGAWGSAVKCNTHKTRYSALNREPALRRVVVSPWLDSRVPLATSHLSWVTVDHANHTFLHHHHHCCLHYNQYVSFPILLICWETSTVSGRVPFPKKVMVMNSWNLIYWVMIMMATMMVAR